MSEPRAAYVTQATAPMLDWRCERRPGSGQFVVSEAHGTLLFRIDALAMVIYCWDKKSQHEVPISLSALLTLIPK